MPRRRRVQPAPEKPRAITEYPEGMLAFCHGCGTKILMKYAVERICKWGKVVNGPHRDKSPDRNWIFHESCVEECVLIRAAMLDKAREVRCKACNEALDEEGMCRNPECQVW